MHLRSVPRWAVANAVTPTVVDFERLGGEYYRAGDAKTKVAWTLDTAGVICIQGGQRVYA